MKPAIIYLATALVMGFGAAPVAAESAPLTLEQEQIVTGIRDRDRKIFISSAIEAGLKNQFGIVKPIAKWTYYDYGELHRLIIAELLVIRGLQGTPTGRCL